MVMRTDSHKKIMLLLLLWSKTYSKINLDIVLFGSVFKTIIDTIFIYSFRYNIKIENNNIF